MRRAFTVRALAAAGAMVLAACSSGTHTGAPSSAPGGTGPKLLVVMEENHTCTDTEAAMPYLTGLGSGPGGAHIPCAEWTSMGHGSLHSYVEIADGGQRGIGPDGPPSPQKHFTGPTVFDQAIRAHATAKIYAEDMPHNCATHNTGNYVVRHNPWPYGYNPKVRADCLHFDVPLGTTTSGQLISDVRAGALPTDSMVVPNLEHNAHNGTLTQADQWLRTWIPLIEAGPDYRSGRLTVVITWDEPDLSESGTLPVETVILNKKLHGQKVTGGPYSLYSLTRWYEDVAGASHMGGAATAADLRAALRL